MDYPDFEKIYKDGEEILRMFKDFEHFLSSSYRYRQESREMKKVSDIMLLKIKKFLEERNILQDFTLSDIVSEIIKEMEHDYGKW